MSGYHISALRPEDIIPRLGKGELHWKKGRSAFELSYRWMQSDGFPESVQKVLKQLPNWSQAKILDAFFERDTDLKSRGRPSQTDLLVLAQMPQENGVIAVEGKVDEPFGQIVHDWLQGDGQSDASGRTARLNGLCTTLGLSPEHSKKLFYQLLHRTCAAIYEAQRYGFPHAIMMVHSFSQSDACFEEFSAFSEAMEIPVKSPGGISSVKTCDGINLRLAWVKDRNSLDSV